MDDIMSTLRGILGDGADEKIKTAMKMLSDSGAADGAKSGNTAGEKLADAINNDIKTEAVKSTPNLAQNIPQCALSPEGIQLLGQIKNAVDRVSNTNDSRSELLRSLKPFMRSERQRSIDRVVRVMNLGRLSGLFGK